MPTSTVNGWTSAGLLPSYTVLASILGSAGGTHNQASTPPPTAPAAPAAPNNPLGTVIPVSKGGFGGGPGGGGGYNNGGGSAMGGGRSAINPSLNPDQAYSQYLQNRALFEGSTPQQSALNIAYYQHQLLNDADPSGLWRNPDAGQIGHPQDPYTAQLQFQSELANRMFQTASPFSYEQGVAPANAPAPAPANGYQAGWTNQPSYGFGF